MTTRICKTEKFIPRTGNPVFQIQEEADFAGVLQLLPPRNPTAQELLDAQDAFAASQQLRISELETELANAQSAIAEKDARIAKLLEEVPFDPREINLHAFKVRLSKVLSPQDLIQLYAAESDPILKQIASTIVSWKEEYPIKLDSRELREPLGYLLAVQLITEEEQTYLVSDSTRAEAFFPADVV